MLLRRRALKTCPPPNQTLIFNIPHPQALILIGQKYLSLWTWITLRRGLLIPTPYFRQSLTFTLAQTCTYFSLRGHHQQRARYTSPQHRSQADMKVVHTHLAESGLGKTHLHQIASQLTLPMETSGRPPHPDNRLRCSHLD